MNLIWRDAQRACCIKHAAKLSRENSTGLVGCGEVDGRGGDREPFYFRQLCGAALNTWLLKCNNSDAICFETSTLLPNVFFRFPTMIACRWRLRFQMRRTLRAIGHHLTRSRVEAQQPHSTALEQLERPDSYQLRNGCWGRNIRYFS